jgi:hypothetical protein
MSAPDAAPESSKLSPKKLCRVSSSARVEPLTESSLLLPSTCLPILAAFNQCDGLQHI